MFLTALNWLVEVKEDVISNIENLMETVSRTEALAEERELIEQEMIGIASRLDDLIRVNVRMAHDQTEYARKEE